MKKTYNKPQISLIEIDVDEVITASVRIEYNPNDILNWDEGLWQ